MNKQHTQHPKQAQKTETIKTYGITLAYRCAKTCTEWSTHSYVTEAINEVKLDLSQTPELDYDGIDIRVLSIEEIPLSTDSTDSTSRDR